jgi:UDP-N-acetylglucosamine 4,6-dehydratase
MHYDYNMVYFRTIVRAFPHMKSAFVKKIKGAVILITGGTGSFGNSVVSQLLLMGPKRIIIFSRDEKKQFDMRNKFDNPLLKFIIGDVRDYDRVNQAMEGVDYVFHAAALKQVPTCEFFPMEAVKTNIYGANNVLMAAKNNKVKRVVVLSTDKAVYPINAIGISKAMMEKVMVAESKNVVESGKKDTIFCGVRYGNVLYTRGSVLPYFINLMQQNKQLSITHLEMTRFLLPLTDAVDLVFYALVNGENGHMYVRKSPAATLETIAQALAKIFDYKPGYFEVGIRAGEKMHETLITQEEFLRARDMGKYYTIPPESQGLDYNKYFSRGKKTDILDIQSYTSENTQRLSVDETIAMLMKLPEMQLALKNWQYEVGKSSRTQKEPPLPEKRKRGRPRKIQNNYSASYATLRKTS